MLSFDLVVIGSGAGASTVAFRARQAGWSVALVDREPLGGTCALRGCDPKKVLIGAAQVKDWADRMRGYGIDGTLQIDWSALQRFKRTFTDPVPEARRQAFERAGITTFQEEARFLDPETLQVGNRRLKARRVVVATGARPASLPIEGAAHLIDSTAFLALDHLPERLVFVGGGYISFEFAHVAARAGAEVTILHRGERPLELFDPEQVAQLVASMQQQGMTVHVETEVQAVRHQNGQFMVEARQGRQRRTFMADAVVHGAGRQPNVDTLDLERGEVAYSRRGIQVNAFLQSPTNPRVYAAGDVADSGGLPLTPVGAMESRVVADNLLHGNRTHPDYRGTPTVVFTMPPLARVGLTEAEARAQGMDVAVQQGLMSDWYSYRRTRSAPAAYKILRDSDSGRLIGAHLLGEGVEELINFFALMLRLELSPEVLREMPWAYPTHASDLPYLI